MFDLEASIRSARAAGVDVWVSGPATPEQVSQLELQLGVSLPASYRRFLLSVGALSLHESVVAGIIEQDPLAESGGSLFGETSRSRQDEHFPTTLLVVQPDDEAPYCLDTSARSGEEMPVVCYQVHTRSAMQIASSFEDWLRLFVFDAAV